MAAYTRYRHHGLIIRSGRSENSPVKGFFEIMPTWIFSALLIAYIWGFGYMLYLLLQKELT